MNYQIELCYGYTNDDGNISHAFKAMDPEKEHLNIG